jgi:hypothetical protein
MRYRRFLPLFLKKTRPHPRISPRSVGSGELLLLLHRSFARLQAVDLAFAIQVVSMCPMFSWLPHIDLVG